MHWRAQCHAKCPRDWWIWAFYLTVWNTQAVGGGPWQKEYWMSSLGPWGPHCVERRQGHTDFRRFTIAFACLPNFCSTKRTLTLLVWGLWQGWLRLALQESKLRKELPANLMRSNREFSRKNFFFSKKNWFCFFMDSTKHWKEKFYLRWMWISRISVDGWIIWLLWLALPGRPEHHMISQFCHQARPWVLQNRGSQTFM